ncbi:hypothetical protein PF010_g32714, partial [Phytophthora fragariae]
SWRPTSTRPPTSTCSSTNCARHTPWTRYAWTKSWLPCVNELHAIPEMADEQKLDAALEQGDQLQLNADEQRADPALDEMLLDQGLNSHRSAPELDADLVLDDASCART